LAHRYALRAAADRRADVNVAHGPPIAAWVV
jgi:hypothetical protein